MRDNINFYRQENAYGEFSNFYYAPITMGGQEWPTTEHYFQAQKFAHLEDKKYVELVRMAKTPSDAAKLGRSRSFPLRPDWEDIKDDVMRDCVLQKFLQHPALAKVLRETGERYLNGEFVLGRERERRKERKKESEKEKGHKLKEVNANAVVCCCVVLVRIEHTRNDRYWADGGDGKGKNMLGIVLMETRAKIAEMTPDQIEAEVAKASGAAAQDPVDPIAGL